MSGMATPNPCKHPIHHQMMPRLMQALGEAMRTTVTLDDELLAKAELLCGDLERSALLKEALRALVQRESAKRLAALGGSEAALEPIPRRQSAA
jgi:Arc/MetJ family transcription regulator